MKFYVFVFLFVTIATNAQNTKSLKPGENSPKAELAEIAWMEGHWKGEAFGGITEDPIQIVHGAQKNNFRHPYGVT